MVDDNVALNPELEADEAHIRRLIEKRSQAVSTRDVHYLVSLYAPDALLFEVLPPLTHRGSDVRESTESWLNSYQGPIGYETRDLNVSVGADVAFSDYLYLVTGTLQSGDDVKMWVRATVCWRKVDDAWFIVHEHQSVPFDPKTGQALTNLAP